MKPLSMTSVAAAVVLFATVAFAQSLAEIARTEEARRKSGPGSGKVYTNEALQPVPPPSPGSVPPVTAAAPPPSPGTDASKPADSPPPGAAPKTEAEWRKRVAEARDALARAQTFAEALQSRVNVLSADFANVDDPAKRGVVGAERQKALAELDRVKQEIQQHQKMITQIQEEARRAGVPVGWTR